MSGDELRERLRMAKHALEGFQLLDNATRWSVDDALDELASLERTAKAAREMRDSMEILAQCRTSFDSDFDTNNSNRDTAMRQIAREAIRDFDAATVGSE